MLAPARKRIPKLLLLPVGVVALFAGYVLITMFQVIWASHQDDSRAVSAIVVLGAAQYDGEPSGALAGRLDHAWELYDRGVAPYVVVTGGNRPGDRFTEGITGFSYLFAKGVPEDAILVEVDAQDTYQALSASRLILRERGLQDAVLVSDRYHNLRLRQIAAEVGLSARVSPTRAAMSWRDVMRETAAVSLGRLIGYRRLANR